jgi:hypothetical protein
MPRREAAMPLPQEHAPVSVTRRKQPVKDEVDELLESLPDAVPEEAAIKPSENWIKHTLKTADSSGLRSERESVDFYLMLNRQQLESAEQSGDQQRIKKIQDIIKLNQEKQRLIDAEIALRAQKTKPQIAPLEEAPTSGVRAKKLPQRDPNPKIPSKRVVTPPVIDPLSHLSPEERQEELDRQRARQIDEVFGVEPEEEEEKKNEARSGKLPPPPDTEAWKNKSAARTAKSVPRPRPVTVIEKQDDDDRITLELGGYDEKRVGRPRDPSNRFQFEDDDRGEEGETTERVEAERLKDVISNNPEVKRWHQRLASIPVVVENLPAREDVKAKLRKAELLAEQKDIEAREVTAKADVETIGAALKKQEKKIEELEENVHEQKKVVEGLRKNVEDKEREREELVAKKESMVGSKVKQRSVKGESALQSVEDVSKKLAERLQGVEQMIKLAKTDEARTEAQLRRDELQKEIAAADRNRDAILENVKKNDVTVDSSPFDALFARADENIRQAEDALNRGQSALEDAEADLAGAHLEHKRLLLKQEEASKRADGLMEHGIKLAVALGGLAAVMMEDDVHVPTEEMAVVPEPTIEAAPIAEPAETPVVVGPDEEIPAKNTLRQNLKSATGYVGIRSMLGLGSAAYATGRFGETFFTNAKKLIDDPGAFFDAVGSRFKKEIAEHGGLLGTLKGIKWLFVGDPDKKKES